MGGHRHGSDHELHDLPGMPKRRPGARPGTHLRREGPHLHTGGLHRVPRHGKHDQGLSSGRARPAAKYPDPGEHPGNVLHRVISTDPGGGIVDKRDTPSLRIDQPPPRQHGVRRPGQGSPDMPGRKTRSFGYLAAQLIGNPASTSSGRVSGPTVTA